MKTKKHLHKRILSFVLAGLLIFPQFAFAAEFSEDIEDAVSSYSWDASLYEEKTFDVSYTESGIKKTFTVKRENPYQKEMLNDFVEEYAEVLGISYHQRKVYITTAANMLVGKKAEEIEGLSVYLKDGMDAFAKSAAFILYCAKQGEVASIFGTNTEEGGFIHTLTVRGCSFETEAEDILSGDIIIKNHLAYLVISKSSTSIKAVCFTDGEVKKVSFAPEELSVGEICHVIYPSGKNPNNGSEDLFYPIEPQYTTITSRYGARSSFNAGGYQTGDFHTGLDIYAPLGTDCYAGFSGVVIFANVRGSYGNVIFIDHGNGIETRYAHLSKILVKEGDVVNQGDLIALIGQTGAATGPHLHFEYYIDGQHTDPIDYVIFP